MDNNKEMVNHPDHYKQGGKECIEVMLDEFGPFMVASFCFLNAFKYRWRAGKKDGNSTEQDLAKAKWYENYAENLMSNPAYFDITINKGKYDD